MQNSEIEALISLLADDDKEIKNHVTNKLIQLGDEAIPFLENAFLYKSYSQPQLDSISEIIETINYNNVCTELEIWAAGGAQNLLDGVFLIAKYRYPTLSIHSIHNFLDKIKLDAWLELNFQLSPLDKVRVLNKVIFENYGFSGNKKNYHAPENSFINSVIDTKKGSPIMLSVIYSLIAQQLKIPIFGVNLPVHFVLAYLEDANPNSKNNEVLFYINTFDKGSIFSKWNIKEFLARLKFDTLDYYYMPCSNLDIVLRILNNLSYAYELKKDIKRVGEVKNFTDILISYAPER
jgi:regulator of sirC expression with transglutaminase-like and TPR domain